MIATDVADPGRMQAALGPDGRGWLVYEVEAENQIRVVPLNARKLLGIRPAPKKHKPRGTTSSRRSRGRARPGWWSTDH